jgi:8-oxo-dGTP pyrophosphatase MutT (NUDIX family)
MAASPGCSTWRTLSGFRLVTEEERFRGSLISVAEGRFEAPDGTTFQRDIVHHPGAVSVVPVLGDSGEVVLVRQYRAAVDRILLEIPAGKRDVAGEPPEETARRELIEEIGMRAGRLEPLAEFFNSPGFSDEHSFVFMALDLAPAPSDLQGIEEQYMTVERVALDDVGGMIRSGAIVDAKTIIGLTLAREALA